MQIKELTSERKIKWNRRVRAVEIHDPRLHQQRDLDAGIHPEGSNKFTLSTGQVQITVGGADGCLLGRMVNGDAVFTDLTGEIEIGGRIYSF
jgi:hypothetical protein